jgi:hypothetical protein
MCKDLQIGCRGQEAFEKCSILFKAKSKILVFERGMVNPPPNFGGLPPRTIFRTYGAGTNTWDISRIEI